MHRSKRFPFTVLVMLLLFTIALAAPQPASAEDNCRTESGEPTDPQRIVDWLQEAGFDLQTLGVSLSTPLEILLNLLRTLGLSPEESGS